MQESVASFGRRQVVIELQGQGSIRTAPGSAGLVRLLLFLFALAAVALLLQLNQFHRRRAVSPTDAAAIEQIIAGQHGTISVLDNVPHVSITYYDVDGTDTAAIRHELNAKGPLDGHGKHFDAVTHWHFDWHWDSAPEGSCGAANAEVSFRAVIRLPHLTHFATLKPEVAQAWRSYMTALVFHEAGHVRIGYDGREAISTAVRTSSCAEANAAGHDAIARLGKEDGRYDDRTDHGANDGATFG